MRRDRTAVLHFLAQLARSLAGFGTTLFTARYFGAAGVGFYSQILALLFWLKLPSNSVKTAVSKRMSESERPTGHFSGGMVAVLGYGVAVGVVLFALQGVVNGYIGADAWHLLAALILVNIAFDMIKSGLVGRKRVAASGWLGTAEQVLRLAGQVAFVLGGAMVAGLVYGHVVSLFVFTLVGLWLLRDRLTVPERSDFGDLRRFAKYSWLTDLRGVALSWTDVLVLGLFVGDDLVGIYTAAWTLSSFLALVGKSIRQTLFPELSDLGTDDEFDRATDLVSDGLLFVGVLLIPGALGAAVIGGRVLAIYESEFAVGGTILVVLVLARTFQGFGSQIVGALDGLDRPDLSFRVNAVFVATNTGLNLLLVWRHGWYGAAVATLTSTVLYLALSWYVFESEIGGIDVPVGEIARQVLAAGAMAAVLVPVAPAVPEGVLWTIAVVFAGAAVYGAALLGLSTRIRSRVRRVAGV
jgi:O-antigen/teichoic acid export membrane protein